MGTGASTQRGTQGLRRCRIETWPRPPFLPSTSASHLLKGLLQGSPEPVSGHPQHTQKEACDLHRPVRPKYQGAASYGQPQRAAQGNGGYAKPFLLFVSIFLLLK